MGWSPVQPADVIGLTYRGGMTSRRTVPNGQHVWVRGADTEASGLLLRWEKRGTAWWGHVVMVDACGGPALVDVLAGLLRPASVSTSTQSAPEW